MSELDYTRWDMVEQLFDLSVDHYTREGLLVGATNYPAIKVVNSSRKGKRGKTRPEVVITGPAIADRSIYFKGGLVAHLEIKTWEAKDQHTYDLDPKRDRQRRQLVQYLWLLEASKLQIPIYYLTYWQWKGEREWRLYPVESVPYSEDHKLTFDRVAGVLIHPIGAGDMPDWYGHIATDIAVNLFQQGTLKEAWNRLQA